VKVLYNISGDFGAPRGGLIADKDGNLYGTAPRSWPQGNSGIVFELVK
jgi:hypothetical protein